MQVSSTPFCILHFNPDQGQSWDDKPGVDVFIPFLFHLSQGTESHEISPQLSK
jgi:hypothetical protein